MAVKVKPEIAFAYAELLDILSFMEEEDVQKIPQKLMAIFKTNASTTYEKHINPNVPLEEQNVSKKTAALLALLSLNYWCDSQEEKEELKEKFRQNGIKQEEELRQKYSYENLFNNEKSVAETSKKSAMSSSQNTQSTNNSNLPVDFNSFPWYKKVYTRIKNFIYKFFKKANNPT